MENIYQSLTLLSEQLKSLKQKVDEASQILGQVGQVAQVASPEATPGVESLSKREKEIFALLQVGLSPTEIAEKLSINPKTVYIHRSSIMKKLKFQSFEQILKTLPASQT